MNDGYREVRFDIYCDKCEYRDTEEAEEPCRECLQNPVNQYSLKPIKFKEK